MTLLLWALRQLGAATAVLLGASLLLFCIVRLAPGDAAGPGAWMSPGQVRDGAREAAGDGGWLSDYGTWISRAVRGDFGRSQALQQGRPVTELLVPAAGRSLLLASAALLASSLAAFALAAARTFRPRRGGWFLLGGLLQLASTIPVFLYVYFSVILGNAVLVWGAGAGWWGLPAWFPLPDRLAGWPWLGVVAILALGDGLFADLQRRFEGELQHCSQVDYLVGVRLLGMSPAGAIVRAFLPGAASHVARRVAFVFGSLVILEAALGWPGLGYLAWRGAAERDLPVLLAVALVMALLVRAAVLLAQGAWWLADPRTRGR